MASTNLSFECCHHCVAPKRHPGCQDKCKEYISVKSAIKEKKEREMARHGAADYIQSCIRKAKNASAIERKNGRGVHRVGYR